MAKVGSGCVIRGTGAALGSVVVDSSVLEERLRMPTGWSADRTGVRSRCHVAPGERTTDLAYAAAMQALEDAGVSPRDLGLVICATMTPEMTCPACSHRLIDRIGATPCGGFDLTAACSGFLAGMHLASDVIRAGTHEHVLVVGSDVLSPTIDHLDPKVAFLFADGAGAAVVSRHDDPNVGCLAQRLHSDGSEWASVYQPRCAADLPPGALPPTQYDQLVMNGLMVFRFAVEATNKVIVQTLEDAGLTMRDVDMVLLHQSNLRIINNVRLEFDLSDEKCPSIIEKTGNTSGGSVGMLLDEQRRIGRLKPGMTIVMAAVGGGLSWAQAFGAYSFRFALALKYQIRNTEAKTNESSRISSFVS